MLLSSLLKQKLAPPQYMIEYIISVVLLQCCICFCYEDSGSGSLVSIVPIFVVSNYYKTNIIARCFSIIHFGYQITIIKLSYFGEK